MPLITMIWAQDENGLIGKDNKLPWRIPADMAYFKAQTLNRPVVMGRKTWESFGSKPLKGRQNIVLTRDTGFDAEGANVVHTPEEALEAAEGEEVMIIGGAQIYELFFPRADRLRVTRVQGTFEGDTHFPKLDWTPWTLAQSEEGPRDEKNPYRYEFEIYERSSESAN
ncbi:dihydrofolate reductase [Saccharibacillus sp. CPCC 101409]|uniref:dihydrofolate reductase n=1 Tax=Saccharibacillus sp. CPCC 101409 TaxID=3058041 RepID=UPI00267272BD|nr:dihydrofolate reductase [Saccharibacillus sp. CPCC 101409]MDO3412860.1 dihydrofolate reductase [Saccharibacillus sp. CPCC 101409]